MLLLGIDIGTSAIKVSVVDAETRQCITAVQYPDTESGVIALQHGWAEQSPMMWWEHVQQAILKANATGKYDPQQIGAIGIAYQMHGLVTIDKENKVLRNSIIWCDSRAVEIGNEAFDTIGHAKCLQHLLNSPGNFTASKLAWVKQNEPAVYDKINKIMLPGDFISLMLTGELTTTVSALSEGVFWDFLNNDLSQDVLEHYGIDKTVIPEIKDLFSEHGRVQKEVAITLSLREGIPVTYKAGDQPNNALSLNVLHPGEIAATAGTSGVIYAVNDELTFDTRSRINSFAHVNHSIKDKRIGALLCINGTGILNRWLRDMTGGYLSYDQMNTVAATVAPGSNGLMIYPFGNGAERMLENRITGAHLGNIDLNLHKQQHLYRAAQESIAFAFRYGLDIMKENGIDPKVIRAGRANLFLSDVFSQCFVDVLDVPVELYNCDGSVGAAIGAGIGAGVYKDAADAFSNTKKLTTVQPVNAKVYDELYKKWKKGLEDKLSLTWE